MQGRTSNHKASQNISPLTMSLTPSYQQPQMYAGPHWHPGNLSLNCSCSYTQYHSCVCLTHNHKCVQGRIGILKVHARDKELEDDIDFHKVARATAGSTGAELMNLMNQSAIVTVRQGRKKITQADIFEVCCSPCSPPPTQNTSQE